MFVSFHFFSGLLCASRRRAVCPCLTMILDQEGAVHVFPGHQEIDIGESALLRRRINRSGQGGSLQYDRRNTLSLESLDVMLELLHHQEAHPGRVTNNRAGAFLDLGGHGRDELGQGLEVHEAGSTIIQEGDDGESLYIIKSGGVRVYTALQDEVIDLAELKPGDIFGEISILTGMPTTANVVANIRTELVKFSKREVVAMAEQHHQLAHLLSETKEHRVHEHIQRLQTEGFV